MGILKLLAEAQAAGLNAEAVEDKLIITGPRCAEEIALELIRCKSAVLLGPAVPSITNGTPARRCLTPARANPAKVILDNHSYLLAITTGMWFFQQDSCPDAGWTCCSDEFLKQIERIVASH